MNLTEHGDAQGSPPNSDDSMHRFDDPVPNGLEIVKLESRVCIQQDLNSSQAGLGVCKSDNKGK